MKNAVLKALNYVAASTSRHVEEERTDTLWDAVRAHPKEAAGLYRRLRSPYKRLKLVWCMQGTSHPLVQKTLLVAARDKDHWVRWAAIEGLTQFTDPAMIPIFVAASKDRAHLPKSVAKRWLAQHGAQQAVPGDAAASRRRA